ncbi:MAG TPA: fluoride efflux transporter CrcB [Mycobacteriales bacterium]|nr:fluoride efflux transporter CrcB [Mycobacteriales bacterium]
MLTLAVGLAASVGAMARYLLDQLVQHQHDQTFPWGTFVINVTGSFVLGLVTGLAMHHGLPRTPALVLGVGFAGGYTTWSTYLWESLALAEAGAARQATLNLAGSLAAGLLAAAAGLGVALL